jgi:hypothetical protein
MVEVGEMTEDELAALRHAAAGMLLFHNGLWGASAGFRWAGPDGADAGQVPQWECEVLELLEHRGLVSVRPCVGARDSAVLVTAAGMRVLSTVDPLAA